MTDKNTQVLLRRRPTGAVTLEDFEFNQTDIPHPGSGQVLVRHTFLSLDPYMRGRMSDAKSYAKPVEIGAVMECQAVGLVERSEAPGFAPGDAVLGATAGRLTARSMRPGCACSPLR
jgi:NADPH-dependent curcumin reductase CurA